MDIICFELSAANKDCTKKFSEVAKQLYNGVPIFEHACDYVNNSASYKRSGRRLELVSVDDFHITVKLTSEGKLEMAAKALSGFTRELLRVDRELYPEEEYHLFGDFLLNSTLFRNVQVDVQSKEIGDYSNLSDVEALKMCVDLFCNNATNTKEEASYQAQVKRKMKNLLAEYSRTRRIFTYYSRMGGK